MKSDHKWSNMFYWILCCILLSNIFAKDAILNISKITVYFRDLSIVFKILFSFNIRAKGVINAAKLGYRICRYVADVCMYENWVITEMGTILIHYQITIL